MFLAQPTYEGLKITAYSTIEATRYLLNDGMTWVITSRFNQDCAEEDFGRQWSLGGRNDNPTIHQFGYQATAYVTVCGGTNRYHQFGYQATVCGGTKGNISSVTKQIHCVCNGLWWYQQVTSVRLPSKYTAYATVCGGTNS